MIFISIEANFSFSEVFFKVFELPMSDFFNFMFLFPISGILLLFTNLFSYILFFIVQAYSLYFHINYESFSWPYLSETPSASAYVLLSLNIMMIIYFLYPRSREIFFNKDLRWWERASRYTINEKCDVITSAGNFGGTISDLSYGGALIRSNKNFAIHVGDNCEISSEVAGRKIQLKGKATRVIRENDALLFGVRFEFNSLLEKYRLRILMFAIGNQGLYEKYR